jgi:hypothetical protein
MPRQYSLLLDSQAVVMVCCRKEEIRLKKFAATLVGVGAIFAVWNAVTVVNWNPRFRVGQKIDNLNGVAVYYNGGVNHSSGRSLTPDAYNLGIKYQCVEFVKRYYYQRLRHKMPDTYGHAKEFFDAGLSDGVRNTRRDLLQFANDGTTKPQPDDLVVFGPWLLNHYGHVAIISAVTDSAVEIVQQNAGPFSSSRETIPLRFDHGHWRLNNARILGWLRKDTRHPLPSDSRHDS